MREPVRWCLALGEAGEPESVAPVIRAATRGPTDDAWLPPSWLMPHQSDGAQRIAGRLKTFNGALLADSVGLGKTYVALAIASRYRRTVVVVPPALMPQWSRVAGSLGVQVSIVSDQGLSRGRPVPAADLVIVNEAHRFRNPGTRRYQMLACRPGTGHLLLLTATPVVNRATDLTSLLSLFVADNALAPLGVPSLERAVIGRDYRNLARAAASIIVARSPAVLPAGGTLPHALDTPIIRASALPPGVLERVTSLVEHLSFPAFTAQNAGRLLALHILYRLASSPAACVETLGRHATYLERAREAAERGERLSRHDARAIFGAEEDWQLGFDFSEALTRARIDSAELVAESARIQELAALVRSCRDNPKSDRLRAILRARGARKTIVFTAAVATARDLARRLGWKRIGVVSGRGAWIASGALPVEAILQLFAPRARGASDPGPTATVDTLLATDLASEGLDLQDADAIVHYDLPWNPLRLEQRLGRIARLGSAHHEVRVWWFVPPVELESRLSLSARIAGKMRDQLDLGMPVSSRVGRARVLGEALGWREHLASDRRRSSATGPVYSIVTGPRAAVFALRWRCGSRSIPEVVVCEGGAVVTDERRQAQLVGALLDGSVAEGSPEPEDVRPLHRLARERLSLAGRGATDQHAARCSRLLLRHAADAARRRDPDLLSSLDATMDRVVTGIAEGPRRTLDALLARRLTVPLLARWLSCGRRPESTSLSVKLEAAVFGTGVLQPLS